jgi:photosystem II stability/assembly factor-like uncharacterized protein
MTARVRGIMKHNGIGGAAHAADEAKFDSATISGLGARNIGSAAMSGRVAAIAGRVEPSGEVMLLVGSASGGVWKSTNGGTTFTPVFDKAKSQSIGALALDPTNPATIWAGTGESWTRNSVSIGDGIYKSTDGGESWTNMGLANSERIAKIIVHPKDGNIVYACVPGKLWSDSADRGLYKTTDGGKNWGLILKGDNLSTGCSSVSLDPQNPDKLFVGLWDFRRQGWTFRSGGEGADKPSGSGLFVTEDGGANWSKLDGDSAKGLPAMPWGRVAVTIAPSDPKIVYALVEATRSALFRSDDGGKTWAERDRSQSMVWRPFYFANLIVDPLNPDRVFKPDYSLIASDDGGKSFSNVSRGTHADHHDVWIDPTNTKHVVTGDDGGLWISYDGGNKWWKSGNLPISQFYHVSVDDKDPYQVYGGLQDNSSWVGDSAYPGGVTNSRWENLYGGDGFWAFPDPADANFAYVEAQGGEIGRVNRTTLAARSIQPQANYKEKLRFNWNAPIHMSPNEKGTLYIGAQFLFRSRDHGQSWDRISPDLTTNDPAKQKQEESGGVTIDNSAAEMHTTIYSISESPKNGKLIWVGTDDGNLQLTRDGGKNWTNVVGNIPGLPKNSWVSWVEASRFAEGTALATFDRHTVGDMTPYAFKTTDYGKTWTRLVTPEQGIDGYAHVIKEDVQNPNLLFLGTEFGLWISIDGGKRWAGFKGSNFPRVAVRDLAVHPRDSDLVVATHGRGIWVIDDITPLRTLSDQTLTQDAAFLTARPVQQRIESRGGWAEGDATFAGDNPPAGATITYYQKARHLFGKLKIEVLDPAGHVIDTIPASKRPGLNRVVWSTRVSPPRVPPAAQLAGSSTRGPRVLPGTYTVRLTKNGQVLTAKLDLQLDRRATFTVAERKQQFDAAMRVRALFGKASDLLTSINAVREGAADRAATSGEDAALKADLDALLTKADTLRKLIVATKEGGAVTGEERIREHMDQLYGALMSYEGKPAQYLLARTDALARELGDVDTALNALTAQDLVKVNKALTTAQQQPILLPIPAAGKDDDKGGGSGTLPRNLAGWRFELQPTEALGESEADEVEHD